MILYFLKFSASASYVDSFPHVQLSNRAEKIRDCGFMHFCVRIKLQAQWSSIMTFSKISLDGGSPGFNCKC